MFSISIYLIDRSIHDIDTSWWKTSPTDSENPVRALKTAVGKKQQIPLNMLSAMVR